MKILLTGGTGFLGRHAALRFFRQGHDVTILGRNRHIGELLQKEGLRYFPADLTEAKKVDEACRGQEQVVHCGGLASPWGKYQDFYQANVIGTRHVVKACRNQGVNRLVHVSTPSLYFNYRHRFHIRENEPLPRQVTAYGATKLLADEEIERAHASGLPTIGIRPRAIFGPGDPSVMARIISAAQRGTIPLVDRGRSYVDLSYVDNVVDALELCLKAPLSVMGKNYNITNGEPITVRALMEKIFSKLRLAPRFRSVPFPLVYGAAAGMEVFYKILGRKQEPPLTRYGVGLISRSQTLDISAARRALGYLPRIDLEEGFVRFAQWWLAAQQNPSELLKLGIISSRGNPIV